MPHKDRTDSINFDHVTARKKPDQGKNLDKTQIILNDTAVSLQRMGNYSKAIPFYEKALMINPKSPILLVNMGVSYTKLGKFMKAESLFDQALEMDPNQSDAFYNKACCKSMKGETQEALELLEHAIKLDPKHRVMARTEEDFLELRDLDGFKMLVF
jgi:tetratricopeptide (TPR) repeat protein